MGHDHNPGPLLPGECRDPARQRQLRAAEPGSAGLVMRVTPYTWQPSDFFTASRLNGELYRSKGSTFQPNGIGFHAAKPVYKAYYSAAAYNSTTTFSRVSGGTAGSWSVVADTAGYFGARADPSSQGVIQLSSLLNGAGLAGAPGGPALIFRDQTLNASTGTA